MDLVDSMSQALNRLIYSYAQIPKEPSEYWDEMDSNERFNYTRKQYTGSTNIKAITDWGNY